MFWVSVKSITEQHVYPTNGIVIQTNKRYYLFMTFFLHELNMCLAPPRIVENDTSASLVVANEFESIQLKCKVSGEPQSQLMWKREDNKPIGDNLEQRFRHESQRKPNHQILSIDSSELVFEPFLRSHSGAYLVSRRLVMKN